MLMLIASIVQLNDEIITVRVLTMNKQDVIYYSCAENMEKIFFPLIEKYKLHCIFINTDHEADKRITVIMI